MNIPIKKNNNFKIQKSVIENNPYSGPQKYSEYLKSKSEELNNDQQNKAQTPSQSCLSKYTSVTKPRNRKKIKIHDDQNQNYDNSFNDMDNNPSWKIKSHVNIDDEDIVIGTPKNTEKVKKLYCSKNNWKISTDVKKSKHKLKTQVTHSPVTSKWIVENTHDITDFQSVVINTLIHMKYEINNISNILQSNNMDIDFSTANANKYSSAHYSNYESNNIIDQVFPIKNDEDLYRFEEKIRFDNDFKKSLIMQLSVFTDSYDLDNSVRRVIGYMFNDNILVNYSLFEFKKKKSFSSLLSYRMIIEVIRTNIKYKSTPEKDIDNCLGIWLFKKKF